MENNREKLINTLMSHEYVTFDIFDTLIARRVLKPSDVHKLIDFKVATTFNKPTGAFLQSWKSAVGYLRLKNPKQDPSFDQIYSQIASFNMFENIEAIKKIHLETELSLVVPRLDVQKIYNDLINAGKKIIIISDMYYPSSFLKQLLDKCGYKDYERIIVSNEYGGIKLTGSLWKKFNKENPNMDFIHVGDSLIPDYLKLKHNKNYCVRISRGTKLANTTYYKLVGGSNLFMSLIYGTIINKYLFNSPFTQKKQLINSCSDFGYAILGPVFLYFFKWLFKNIKTSQLLFISREGWYFQKMYKDYIEAFYPTEESRMNVSIPSSIYLYTSRRAVLTASIQNWKDIAFVCGFKYIHFKGDAKLFFKNKFNVDIKDEENFKINLLNKKSILKLAKKYEQAILQEAASERETYLEYLNKNVNQDGVIIDYSGLGTIQYFISKLLGRKLLGGYIVKTNGNKFDKLGIKRMGCFPFQLKNIFTPLMVWYVFEAFLVAPHGQFIMMDKEGKPVFASDVQDEYGVKIHDEVYLGIKQFFDDMKNILPKNWDLTVGNAKTIFNVLKKFYVKFKSHPTNDDLINFFSLTDVFSGKSSTKVIRKKNKNGKTKN